MSDHDPRHRGAPTKHGVLWVCGIAATAALHGGILLSVWLYRGHAEAHPINNAFNPGTVIDVQAVKFGKPRDLSFLPHKQQVVVDKQAKPALQLTKNDQALPHLKDPKDEEKPVEVDPLKTTRSEQFKQQLEQESQAGVEGEGDPNGVRGGTATVGRGPIYYQHLKAAVQNAWTVPTTIPDQQLAKLDARACFKMDESGKMTEAVIAKPSHDERFDATLLQALATVKESWSEVPTPDVREAVTHDGVCIDFKGNEQR